MRILTGFCLGLLLLAAPAGADTRAYSQACRQQCSAASPQLAANPPPVQACLIRCQAGSDFTRGVNQGPRRTVAASVPALPAGSWGVIYAAVPPSPAYGASQGQRDRNLAHVEAERACSSRAQGNCRPLAEAGPGECVAIAQAGRVTGLVRTADPRTWQVSLVEYGKGQDKPEAERQALMNCGVRGQCEVVAVACGSR